MYSGTGALKTDFTRTGQRTKAGALQDLSNSLTRYVKNNFKDGQRQDAFDLFLGNYQIPAKVADSTTKQVSPFTTIKPLRVRVVNYMLHIIHYHTQHTHTHRYSGSVHSRFCLVHASSQFGSSQLLGCQFMVILPPSFSLLAFCPDIRRPLRSAPRRSICRVATFDPST